MRVRVERPQVSIKADLGWGWGRYSWPNADMQRLFRERGLADWMVRGWQIGPFRFERTNPRWPT